VLTLSRPARCYVGKTPPDIPRNPEGTAMPTVHLSAGPIEYDDTGGSGPCLVLLHGVLMNGTVWRKVVAQLVPEYRCVVPTLPLGAHRIPMSAEADLSNEGLCRLIAEFLEHLDLRDVTLIINDWGGAQLLVDQGLDARVAAMVLVACEAFENFPPGRAGLQLGLLARTPGGLRTMGRLARRALVRRAAARSLAKYPISDSVLRGWFEPLASTSGIARDLRRFCVTVPLRRRRNWSAGLARFDKPALVVWACDDVMMPREHGQRLAETLPQGRLVEVADSATLVAEDQPEQLAAHLRSFVGPGHRPDPAAA
jgi:pimeloyl-ACP methyl ester carboxylesterase